MEIEDAKAVADIALGVPSHEARRQGINEWNRKRLIRAGADVIVPDSREHEKLTAYLWGEANEI